MSAMTKTAIADLDPTWHWELGARVPVARAEAPGSTEGMVKIPGGPLRFQVRACTWAYPASIAGPCAHVQYAYVYCALVPGDGARMHTRLESYGNP